MIKMKLLVFCVSAFLFNVCSGLPIGTANGDQQTAVIIGSLVLFGIGAIIGACTFCRRRKRNFEKFENEGNIEPQATQYPIFRALSTNEVRQSTVIVPSSPPNLSKDNLLDNDNGGNNYSPILSSNIQKSQSEHVISISGENEMERVINTENIIIDDSQITIISETKIKPIEMPIITETHTKTTIPTLEPENKDDVCSLSSITIDISSDYVEEEVAYNECTNPFVEELEKSLLADRNQSLNPFIRNFHNEIISNDDICNVTEHDIEKIQIIEETHLIGGYGTFASTDNSNIIPSTESTSVEEALRALDIAIGDDDDEDIEDLPYTIGENDVLTLDANTTNFEDILKNLLIFSGNNNQIDSIQTAENNVTNADNLVHINDIKREATQLVDSVMKECIDILENRLLKASTNENLISDETVIAKESIVPLCEPIVVNSTFLPTNTGDDNNHFDNFLNEIITSTPCIKNKNFSRMCNVNNNEINPKLFYEEESVRLDDENVASNETYQIIDDVKHNHDASLDGNENALSNSNNTFQISPVIKIDKDDIHSEDLSTVTPVNTPCEFNYNNDTWDKMVNNDGHQFFNYDNQQPSTSSAGASTSWFLHPQAQAKTEENMNEVISDETFKNNETFKINELTYNAGDMADNEDNDSEYDYNNENCEGDMSEAYEELRKQLVFMLPHAQGNIAGPPEYSDEEDSNDKIYEESKSSQELCINKNNNLDDGLNLICALASGSNIGAEMFINYKRTLSPIMEESEDETCKTFVYNNETRCLDSTSTGCMESEAIMMGVAKTLMASNDTLFNFEDTLDDNLFSPRNIKTPTNHPDIISMSQGNENYDSGVAVESISEQFFSKNYSSDSIEPVRSAEKPSELSLKEMSSTSSACNTFDLSSPDQPEQPSLDLDLTFTIDEKTCIFIKNEEERISETSEPDLVSESSTFEFENKDLCNSLLDDDIISLDEDSIHDILDQQIPDDENMKIVVSNEITKEANDFIEEDESSSEILVPTRILFEKANIIECVENLDVQNSTLPNIHNDYDQFNENIHIPTSINKISDTATNSLVISASEMAPNEKALQIIIENKPFACFQTTIENLSDDNEAELEVSANFFPANETSIMNEAKNVTLLEAKKSLMDIIPISTDETLEKIVNISVKDDQNIINSSVKSIESMKKLQDHDINELVMEINSPLDYEMVITQKPDRNDHGNLKSVPVLNRNSDNSVPESDRNIQCGIVNNIPLSEDEKIKNLTIDAEISFLSGEEDPWGADIRLSTTEPDLMTTSFSMPEWDSEADDDSNSSEEFMYVKGRHQNNDISSTNCDGNPDEISSNIWTHQDRIPVNLNNDAIKEESEDSSSDAEEEFVPSSWDSMAMPARSALKSPDKTNENKKRQNVAFKKQRYHSVYEYPREIPELSPAYSEPQLWDRHFDDFRLQMEQYTQDIDGFTISSSTRPFHGSQFHAQCNTWPTDSDFSWSQIEDNNSLNQNDLNSKLTTELTIDWPKRLNNFESSDDFGRPDSGVGESAELLSESLSLGDLCHTKDANNSNDDLDNNSTHVFDDNILPTPSCTGSMDSLSSSSGSDRPISFTTFGKKEPNNIYNINEENDLKTAIVLIEDNTKNILLNNCRNSVVRLSDSTDEDSGIENISRLTK